MLNFLRSIDFMSFTPKLKVNNKSTYQTVIGGLISMILTILTLVGIGYFSQELLFKNEPIAIESIKAFNQVGPYENNNDDYNLFVAVEDKNFVYYDDPSIFTFKAYYLTTVLDKNMKTMFNKEEFEIKRCDNYYYKTLNNSDTNKNYFNKTKVSFPFDLSIFYCLKVNKANIEGYWGNPNNINSYIRIELEKCQNSTNVDNINDKDEKNINNNNVICKSKKEIDEKINGGILSTFSFNNLLQLDNYKIPVKKQLVNYYTSLNVDLTFSLFFLLRPLEFISDSGFILEDIQITNTFYWDEPKMLYFGKRDNRICDISIQGKNLGKKINRSYVKFQDVLTKIGGLVKALTVVGSIIVNYASKILFLNDYIFNLNLREEENVKSNNFDVSHSKLKGLVNNNLSLNNNINNKNISKLMNNDLSKKMSFTNNNNVSEVNMITGNNINNRIKFNNKNINENNNISKINNSKIELPSEIKKYNIIDNLESSNVRNLAKLQHNTVNNNLNNVNRYSDYSLNSTNKLYSSSLSFKDLISTLFNKLFCRNNQRTKLQNSINLRIDDLLSIDKLFEKLYVIEVIESSLERDYDINSIKLNYPNFMGYSRF